MKRPSAFVPILMILGLVACGDDNGPGNPNGPSPVLTSVAITPGTDLIKIKATESLTATATYDNGSTRTVQAAWSTDAPAVASVEASGRVTGNGSGQATVSAEYEGKRATRLLRVVPDYQGTWIGDWSVTGCSDSGDFQEVCREFGIGALFALTFVFAQNRDAVTGTTDFGDDLPGQVTGTIRMDGVLVISATYTINVDGMLLELTLTDWETTSTDNQRMTGHICVIGRAAGVQGSFEIDGELHVVSKVSSQPAAAGAPGSSGRRGLLKAIRGR